MYAKTAEFEVEQQTLAQLAKVLSHPARLAIIQLLAEKQDCIVGDIAQEFSFLSRTTVSQHLQELKKAGIIKGEIDGVKICYCLDFEVWEKAKHAFQVFFEKVNVVKCC
jgi:ArsR family transcriptional regulator, arsenate/arsenite/antimonite-responsive transcriptional repressor